MLALCEVIGIMEVDDTLFMCLGNLFRQKHTLGQILTNFARHVITLGRVNDRILVRVLLLHFFVQLVNESKDTVVCGVGLTGQLALIAITNVLLRNLVATHLHDTGLNHILDILYVHCMGRFSDLTGNLVSYCLNLEVVHLMDSGNLRICLTDCIDNLLLLEVYLTAITLNNVGAYF